MNKKSVLKKRVSIILTVVLLLCSMTVPAGAVGSAYQWTETVETEFGVVEVENVLTVHESLTRSNTKSASYAQTIKYGGQVVAEVTLFATFGYDGKTAWVSSASGSHTTYSGWSYGSENISTSGGTATLTAMLSHSSYRSISVKIPLTCSPTGQIS